MPAAELVSRPTASHPEGCRTYRRLLNWTFAAFNATRLFAYLPALWTIHTQADSSQHSLLTWLAWVGANTTMAAWLYEHNGHRCDRAVLVNIGNAVMCAAAVVLIACYR